MKFKWAAAVSICFLLVLIYLQFKSPSNEEKLPTISSRESPSDCFTEASALMDSGKSSLRTIALLRQASSLSPNNADYHIALAEAYTYRAALVFRAVFFRDVISRRRNSFFPELIKWEVDRFDPTADDYHNSRPVEEPYHTIAFKDDNSPLQLSNETEMSEIIRLYNDSQRQWDDARGLPSTKKEKAQILCDQAWSEVIFGQTRFPYVQAWAPEVDVKTDFEALESLPDTEQIMATVTAAINMCPRTGAFYRAAGDMAMCQNTDSSIPSTSLPYYKKSLVFDPHDEALWLKVGADDYACPSAVAQWYMSQACKANPNNALCPILCAGFILAQTPYNNNFLNSPTSGDKTPEEMAMISSLTASDLANERLALHYVGLAAAARTFSFDMYQPLISSHLRLSLTLVCQPDVSLESFTKLRNSARDICGVALADGLRNRPDEGVRLAASLAKDIEPACTDLYFSKESVKSDRVIEGLVAYAVKGIALHTQYEILKKSGPASTALAAKEELAAFRSHCDVERSIAIADIKEMHAEDPQDFYSYY